MFKILQRSLATGVVTTGYPDAPAQICASFRGAPRFDFANWQDARPAAAVCPTEAISIRDSGQTRQVTVDYGLCVYCGECSEAGPAGAVRMSGDFELAVRERQDLVTTAEYALAADGSQRALLGLQKDRPSAGDDRAALE